MVSAEFGEPHATSPPSICDVSPGNYGSRLHFWDLDDRRVDRRRSWRGRAFPLEVRFLHDPDAEGFVGAALSSTICTSTATTEIGAPKVRGQHRRGGGLALPVPGLITDLLISMDDRYLYLSNWLHGDIRQYDISDPANPKLTGQLWLGGLLGKRTD